MKEELVKKIGEFVTDWMVEDKIPEVGLVIVDKFTRFGGDAACRKGLITTEDFISNYLQVVYPL
ncbi:MAG: hypothetical protein R6U17_03185 [Thermoplasmata archaeon]